MFADHVSKFSANYRVWPIKRHPISRHTHTHTYTYHVVEGVVVVVVVVGQNYILCRKRSVDGTILIAPFAKFASHCVTARPRNVWLAGKRNPFLITINKDRGWRHERP